jgi:hypothetical protein
VGLAGLLPAKTRSGSGDGSLEQVNGVLSVIICQLHLAALSIALGFPIVELLSPVFLLPNADFCNSFGLLRGA